MFRIWRRSLRDLLPTVDHRPTYCSDHIDRRKQQQYDRPVGCPFEEFSNQNGAGGSSEISAHVHDAIYLRYMVASNVHCG